MTVPSKTYRHAHPGTIIEIALARPSRHQVFMYVLTDGPPGPERLAADYPHQLCVARSKYTRAEVHTAYGAFKNKFLAPEGTAAGMYSLGRGLTAHGQVDVELELREVTPAIAADAAAFTPGLVKLEPWLSPRRWKSCSSNPSWRHAS